MTFQIIPLKRDSDGEPLAPPKNSDIDWHQ
jgi:hypothetical protein